MTTVEKYRQAREEIKIVTKKRVNEKKQQLTKNDIVSECFVCTKKKRNRKTTKQAHSASRADQSIRHTKRKHVETLVN